MNTDRIQRWITGDNAFRVLGARSTLLVGEAVTVAGASPEVAAVYGQLLTGATLFQLAQAPIDRVQCELKHDGPCGTMLVDVWPGSEVRGRVEHPAPEGDLPVFGAGSIYFSRRKLLRHSELYESVVPIPHGSVADAFQTYCLESEQILTFFSLVCVAGPDRSLRAGGMLIQGLPEMRHEHLEPLTHCLETHRFENLVAAGDDPLDAVAALLAPLSLQPIGEDQLTYRCRCSKEVAVRAIMTLDEAELDDVRRGGSEEVTCEFCSSNYTVTAADLAEHG